MGVAAIPYALAAAAAAGQYVNTQNTARRQDGAAADAIRNQAMLQRKADTQVDSAVQKLQGSTSADANTQRLNDYMNTLRRNKATADNGLTPTIGSQTFQTDAATRATGANDFAAKTAGLMARMDAPGMQRQQEGFDYGNLATNIGLVGRESQGQNFLDQLRLNAIRRNAKIDLASGLMMAGAGGMMNRAPPISGYGAGSTVATGGGFTANLPFRQG